MQKHHNAQAKRLRDLAEECRALAEFVGQPRTSYLRLAEAYELLAEEEDLMRLAKPE